MRLHYQILGQGPPLVVLHGLFGSLDNWRAMGQALAGRFEVIAVDQRNHGRSPHRAEMNYPLMAGDLRELVEELGLARVSVLGHSMGGKTAMEYALDQPGRVERLIVVDIGPQAYEPLHEGLIAAMLALDLAVFETRAQIEAALAPAIPDAAVRRFLLKSVTGEGGGGFRWRFNLPAIQEHYGALGAALARGRTCARPALFIRGADSAFLPVQAMASIRELFPEAKLQSIAGARHWVHADAPDAFLAAVLEFLGQPG
jgi:esterase